MSTFDETKHPRGHHSNPGRFTARQHSAPETTLAADTPNLRDKFLDRRTRGGHRRDESSKLLDELTAAHDCDNLVHALVYEGFATERQATMFAAQRPMLRASLLMGGKRDITDEAWLTADRLLGAYPGTDLQVTVHERNHIDLILAPSIDSDDFGVTATRASVDKHGHIFAAGFGEDWEEDDPDALTEMLERLGRR